MLCISAYSGSQEGQHDSTLIAGREISSAILQRGAMWRFLCGCKALQVEASFVRFANIPRRSLLDCNYLLRCVRWE